LLFVAVVTQPVGLGWDVAAPLALNEAAVESFNEAAVKIASGPNKQQILRYAQDDKSICEVLN